MGVLILRGLLFGIDSRPLILETPISFRFQGYSTGCWLLAKTFPEEWRYEPWSKLFIKGLYRNNIGSFLKGY